MREICLIIFCIFLYGGATFFKRLGLVQLHPYQFLLLTGVCYLMCVPLWLWLLGQQNTISNYSRESILFVVLYSVLSIGAGLILAFLLRNTNNPGTLIIMTNLSSLVTLFLTYIFLNEQLNTKQIIAILFGICSLVLMNC